MKNFKILGLILLVFAGMVTSCEEIDQALTNPLTAEAGEEQQLVPNAMALLDGSGSVNSVEAPINYHWELIKKPEGATIKTSTLNKVAVQFSTNKPGEYVFKLTVTYQSWFDSDTVRVIVVESPVSKLEANVGENQEILKGNSIQARLKTVNMNFVDIPGSNIHSW